MIRYKYSYLEVCILEIKSQFLCTRISQLFEAEAEVDCCIMYGRIINVLLA